MGMLINTADAFKELRDMESRFQSLFPSISSDIDSNVVAFSPAVNTREGDYAYHVEVDLPGMKKKDIHVEVKDNRLVISGERKSKKEVEEKGYYRSESSYGRFERSFTLPDNVDSENIDANSKDGVLEVVIPKKKRSKIGKKVDVK